MGLSQEHREWLTLCMVPGIGTAMFIRLLARYHTPQNVLCASRQELADMIGKNLADRIKGYAEDADIAAQERAMAACGAHLITLDDPGYPSHLAEIYDPPLALFVRGELHQADESGVAIVGTRKPTTYGLRMAERLGRELGRRGITVVSGLAYGIDAAAHRGALEAGGRTIAVLGNGVDVVYPRQHKDLQDAVASQGAVLSQFAMGVKPSAGHFPHRNRIISGLTLGTVVVEAPLKSGALITARQAAEQGREVFALPGQVGVEGSRGPHALIKQGAKLVESAEDIIEELSLVEKTPEPTQVRQAEPEDCAHTPAPPTPLPKPRVNPAASTSELEKDVMAVLGPDGSFVDEIALACRVPVSEALSTLTVLELKGLVRQYSGKRFALR